jgi:F-type H+-transporting ATPase subunit d
VCVCYLFTKMSGAGKKIADVTFKAGRTIDWDGMAKLIFSEEARKEFATLRRTFDEVNSQLQTKFSQVSLIHISVCECIL